MANQPSFLLKLQELITGTPSQQKQVVKGISDRDLMRMESEIGRQLFGPIPAGHRREFFCLDEHAWIWFEEWTDPSTGKKREITTRYEIHPHNILKVQDSQPYRIVEGEELSNLAVATTIYAERVLRGIYGLDPWTGKPLTTVPDTIPR